MLICNSLLHYNAGYPYPISIFYSTDRLGTLQVDIKLGCAVQVFNDQMQFNKLQCLMLIKINNDKLQTVW